MSARLFCPQALSNLPVLVLLLVASPTWAMTRTQARRLEWRARAGDIHAAQDIEQAAAHGDPEADAALGVLYRCGS